MLESGVVCMYVTNEILPNESATANAILIAATDIIVIYSGIQLKGDAILIHRNITDA